MSAPGDLPRQLTDLADLHRRGLLTDAEFGSAKAALLGSTPTPPRTIPPVEPSSPSAGHAEDLASPAGVAGPDAGASGEQSRVAETGDAQSGVAVEAAPPVVPQPRVEPGQRAAPGQRTEPDSVGAPPGSPGPPPESPGPPVAVGRTRRWVWPAVAVTVVVAVAVIVPVVVLHGHSSGRSGRSTAIASPAQALPTEAQPSQIGGSLIIWLVGAPGDPAPIASLPADFSSLLSAHGITPVVFAKSADSFPSDYASAGQQNLLPDIMEGPDNTPFQDLVNDPAQRIQRAFGPLDVAAPLVYLPGKSPHHSAAVRLATFGRLCANTPQASSSPRSATAQAAVQRGLQAITAWLRGDQTTVRSLLADDSILSPTPTVKMRVDHVASCLDQGTDRTRLEQVSAAIEEDGAVGDAVGVGPELVLLARQGSDWKVESITAYSTGSDDAPLFGLLGNAAGDAASGGVQITMLKPPDRAQPLIDEGDNPYVEWTLTGATDQVLGQWMDFVPPGNDGYWMNATDISGNLYRAYVPSTGPYTGERWRVVVLLKDGTLVFSPTQQFG